MTQPITGSVEEELEKAFREELGPYFSASVLGRLVERAVEIVPRWIGREPE